MRRPFASFLRARIALLALAVFGTSCSGVSTAVGGAQDLAAGLILPIDQEIALGAELQGELSSELTFHPDAELQAYIAGLGQQVVAASGASSSIQFTFSVVDDDATINAFAIPGGHIYLYTGLLLAAESEAEVVAVLCHEVAHVTERHSAERLVAAYGVQGLTNVALGRDPNLLAQLTAQFAGSTAMNGHSRAGESEADTTGFRTMLRVGYDPQGFVDFFSRLTGSARPPQFLSSHPNPENRIENIQALMRAAGELPTRRNEAEYLAMRSRI